MKREGYYRNPTVGKGRIVFCADDDLWQVSLSGGKAERLTASTGEANDPVLSPDEKWIAFTSTHEGHGEVYLMPSEGGEARRLTFIAEGALVVGWTPQGEVIYSTTKNLPFRTRNLYKMDPKSGISEKIPCGPSFALLGCLRGHVRSSRGQSASRPDRRSNCTRNRSVRIAHGNTSVMRRCRSTGRSG